MSHQPLTCLLTNQGDKLQWQGLRGDQGTAKSSAPKQDAKESKLTATFGGQSPTETAGTKAKKGKTSIQDASSETPHREETKERRQPIKHKDSPVHPATTSGVKSRIPKKSTSDSDLKSPVTSNKTAAPDLSGSLVSPTRQSRSQVKNPAAPTKSASAAKLVNGLEKSHEQGTIVKAQPPHTENTDVKKHGQVQVEANVSTPSKSRVPISLLTRTLSERMTKNKKSTVAGAESGGNNTPSQAMSSEQQGPLKHEEKIAGEIQSLDHDGAEKGRTREYFNLASPNL